MTTKVLLLSGSKDQQGKGAEIMAAVAKGVAKAGGTSESIFLTALNLERCRQCDSDGWGICRREHWCIIKDDFPALVDKINAADVVVLVSPVYLRDLAESMRCFMERLTRVRFVSQLSKERPIPAPPAVGICYSGGSGMGMADACASIGRLMEIAHFDIVDMIPLRRQNLPLKLPMLETIGGWLATKPNSGPPLIPDKSKPDAK